MASAVETVSALGVVIDLASLATIAGILAAVCAAMTLRSSLRSPEGYGGRVGSVLALLLALGGTGLGFREKFLICRQEEVRFVNGDVSLAGTLFLPPSAGPYPAVVVVHGSGRETRKGDYSFYARLLARNGVAGLAYDKRGAGASSGDTYGTDYAGYAQDALAAVRLLRERPDIYPRRVGILGISEGEWVGSIAAASDPAISFLAVLSACGVTPAQQVAAEMNESLRERGHSEEFIRRALALNEQVYAYQRTGRGGSALAQALQAARAEPWFLDAEDIPEEVYPPEEYGWWRSVMDFDPAPLWERVRAPVLVIKGGRDPKYPAAEMQRNIETALRRGGNDRYRILILPGADHYLLEWPFGKRVPPPVFAADHPDALVAWVRERAAAD
jgi:pimeloyl-ACP methyl ester carboxylesterase